MSVQCPFKAKCPIFTGDGKAVYSNKCQGDKMISCPMEGGLHALASKCSPGGHVEGKIVTFSIAGDKGEEIRIQLTYADDGTLKDSSSFAVGNPHARLV